MSKTIFVSNRLPVTVSKNDKKISFKESIGGLATGLKSVHTEGENIWVGWSGLTDEELENNESEHISQKLKKDYNCIPINLTIEDLDMFYYGFCNNTIWPLFHYFQTYTEFDGRTWEAYKKVNEIFFDTLLKIIDPYDTIWVHDYQLMLLPKLIKDKFPTTKIAFFNHIPFPSYEIFRLLPWRTEVLEGILGADLIGFHTYDYVRHFISSVRRILGVEQTLGNLFLNNRLIKVDAFPMGIDYKKYNSALKSARGSKEVEKIGKELSDTKMILSVDRLDYTKGIPERLRAFNMFLEKYPSYRKKVTLIMVVAPSRIEVETYLHLKKEIEELVSQINGQHGTIGWVPIQYFYRSFSFTSLTALYGKADILLVTPLRDGMNLIAKEYIVTKDDKKGVVILSETAGASEELGEAIIVNPNNGDEIADAIKEALEIPEEEQLERNTIMHDRLKRYDVISWAHDFFEELQQIKERQENLLVKKLTPSMRARLLEDYRRSKKRLLLLDYDGTLVAFRDKPEKAAPDKKLLTNLKKLSADPHNEVILISGRGKDILEKWFGDLNINIIAGHGIWFREKEDKIWHVTEKLNNEWKEEIRSVLDTHVNRTPGSFIEEKEFSLAWHYRRCDLDLGTVRASELKEALLNLTQNLNIGVLEGNKVLEVKNTSINKGRGASLWVNENKWDFILAIGDDWTDEDMFAILPTSAYSIKVGFSMSSANFNIDSLYEVRHLLDDMTKKKKSEQ